jgi:exopolyphosphatase/guanosine-5'-triphosphate,3'-diphosphate pyrophosphatase
MRLAAIDIGTNSVHMIIVRVRPDLSFEVVDREKDMIRLGAGDLDGRRLAPAAMEAAHNTLARFKRLAETHGVDEILATATSAVREAENGGDFVAAVRRDLGIRVRIISGKEEARLIHLAAAYAAGVGGRPAVVIDIGGGSVEITLGTAARMQVGGSFKVGVIRLTERFVTGDPLPRADERRMVRHIRRQTSAYLRALKARDISRVIGTSGTIHALAALASEEVREQGTRRNVRIPAKAFTRVRRQLTTLPLAQRLVLPGLDPRRADVNVAGAVLLDTLLDDLGATDLTLCDFALREGLVLDYIKKNGAHIRTVERYPDVRRRSVMELAERCRYVAPHAQQVAHTALALFDGTQPLHQLDASAREWLEFAAILHDIGAHISYEKHHKHSQYLIEHGDLRGFEPGEVRLMALVARYHRQSVPKKAHADFAALSSERRHTVRVLSALLRLAEGLDRSHAQVVDGLDIQEGAQEVSVTLRTSGDPELELWAAARHAEPLADVLGKPIRFVSAQAARRGRPRAPRTPARLA